ncbi:hypothetical protein HGP17_06250 [Rhizobium sp. P38BS-XIX]|uniref:exo-alpha-sialidase n=1 Tax=Rhizobium sp. P38BS-XIX TaxID=2726740 RepID=UPI001457635B|nr:exo-alpha-sialidase [Rhizobium sp. P38BS-XIX]NLR96432.1 hypothetical protein [Rhizobium sp. P38BS-XIX]
MRSSRRDFLLKSTVLTFGVLFLFNEEHRDHRKNHYLISPDPTESPNEFPDTLPNNYFRLSSAHGVSQNGGYLTNWETSGGLFPTITVNGTNLGVRAASIEFPGGDQGLVYEDAAIAGLDDFTIFILLRPDQSASDEFTIISKSLGPSKGFSWRIYNSPSKGVEFASSMDGTSENSVNICGIYTPGHELAVVVRKSGARLSRWINKIKSEDQAVSAILFDKGASICIGGRGGSASTPANDSMRGGIKEIGLFNSAITDRQCEDLSEFLIRRSGTKTILSWGSNPLDGSDFPVSTGTIDTLVAAANGAEPTEADLNSHRYHHHTRVVKHNKRLWIMYSSGGTNEDASGQMTIAKSSLDDGGSFGSPVVICGPQSKFDGIGETHLKDSRISYPRCFIINEDKLYAVVAVDLVVEKNVVIGDALLARECMDDGTVGRLVRISSNVYKNGSDTEINPYDPKLAAAIFDEANLFGTWGGSTPGEPESAWIGWIYHNGETFAEPATLRLSEGRLLRVWRAVSRPTKRIHIQNSEDNGVTWGPLVQTNIPDNPSSAAVLLLADGRIALVFNPIMTPGRHARDPLLLALFDPATGVVQNIVSVRKGASDMPVFPGSFKGGSAAYPGVWQDGGILFVSSSHAKEEVYLTKVAISAGLDRSPSGGRMTS